MRVRGVFFTGCGLRQQDALKIFNASMDLFLMNCIIFKVTTTTTFYTALKSLSEKLDILSSDLQLYEQFFT